MKYLVMECHLSYAVVLGDDGQFLKVANRHYEVGQTVIDIVQMQVPETAPAQQKKKPLLWLRPLAAMAACLILVFAGLLYRNTMTYASVYLTINPQVRIDVNRKDIVVGLEGINEDGIALIQGYSYEKKDLDLVMDELVDLAIALGYLHEGGQITLTLDAQDNQWAVEHSDTLTNHLSQHLAQSMTVIIEVETVQEGTEGVYIPGDDDSDYGESDYGEATAPNPTRPTGGGTDDSDDTDDGQSDYGNTDDDGQTDYSSTDDGQTDYGNTEDADHTDYSSTTADSHSDYGDTDDGDDDPDDDDQPDDTDDSDDDDDSDEDDD